MRYSNVILNKGNYKGHISKQGMIQRKNETKVMWLDGANVKNN